MLDKGVAHLLTKVWRIVLLDDTERTLSALRRHSKTMHAMWVAHEPPVQRCFHRRANEHRRACLPVLLLRNHASTGEANRECYKSCHYQRRT